MEFLRRLAKGCVVLLDEVPTNLVLSEVASRAACARGIHYCRCRSPQLVGGAMINITVCRHGYWKDEAYFLTGLSPDALWS